MKNIDYKLYYQADTFGNIWSMRTDKILKPDTSSHYARVIVGQKHNKRPLRVLVHRFVAKTFIPNPENKPQVNHIDGNPLNNNVSNLEWVTHSENALHANSTGLSNVKYRMLGKTGEKNHLSKTVYQYSMEYSLVTEFSGIRDAERILSIDSSSISKCCNGKQKSAGGFKWSYIKLEII